MPAPLPGPSTRPPYPAPLPAPLRGGGGGQQSAAQLRPAVPCARLRPLLDEQLLEGQLRRVDHLGQVGLEPELELRQPGHELLRSAQRHTQLRVEALVEGGG